MRPTLRRPNPEVHVVSEHALLSSPSANNPFGVLENIRQSAGATAKSAAVEDVQPCSRPGSAAPSRDELYRVRP